MARRTGTLSIFAALLALLMALWAPAAMAGHKDDHNNNGKNSAARNGGDKDGDADDDPDTSHDEDSDSDGVDNDEDTTPSSHPSGKDKYVEPGGSGNQGRSESNPDDTNGPRRFEGQEGSPDKPNGAGGEDIYDQDGNNGCGNDQDFDDDNNGWCGKPTDRVRGVSEEKKPDDICDADLTMPGIQKCEKIKGVVEDEVQGEVIVDRPGGGKKDEVEADLEENPAQPEQNAVLGIRVSAAPEVAAAAVAPAAVAPAVEAEGAVLPFTGASDLLPFAAIGLMLVGTGALSLRGRRNDA